MSLKTKLQKLVDEAEAAAPYAVKVELYGGLNINLRRDGNEYVLTLWRYKEHKNFQEWNTVCLHLPFKVPITSPERSKVLDKFVLRGRIPAPVQSEPVETPWRRNVSTVEQTGGES
jgi:hypothetical protein